MSKKQKTLFLVSIFCLLFSSSGFIALRIEPPVEDSSAVLFGAELSSITPPYMEAPEHYRELFEAAGREAGLPPGLLESIAFVESRFNPHAVSMTSENGRMDMGMFQFSSDYLEWYAAAYNGGIPFDPLSGRQSIQIAAKHLKWLYDRYGHWPDAVMAYNAGINRIDNGTIPESTWGYLMRVYSQTGL